MPTVCGCLTVARFGDPADCARAQLIAFGWHGDPASHRVAEDPNWRLLVHTELIAAHQLPDRQLGTPPAQWKLDVSHAATTPYDHCVLVMPTLRQLRSGVTVARLARRAPL